MIVAGITVFAKDRKRLLRDVSEIIASRGANIEYVQQFVQDSEIQIYFELADIADLQKLTRELKSVKGVKSVETHRPFNEIYGKRVIVMGGGAQVSQVVHGAISEADRHNLRGERISVDTIPLVGEEKLAEAVRAVGRLHRAAVLVLAGSIMGGEITKAVKQLRSEYKIPVVSLSMAGSVPDACDLVVSDPIQAGVMAVMHVADTAKFDIRKLKKKRF